MGVDEENARSLKSVQSRWMSLNKNMARFAAAVQQVKMINETGKTIEDQFQDALKLYNHEVGSAFVNVSSYNIVKHSAKWTANPQYLEFCGPKKRKRNVSIDNESDEVLEIDALQSGTSIGDIKLPQIDRPAGVKQSKRSRSSKHDDHQADRAQIVTNSTSTAQSTERIAETLDRASNSLQAMLELSLLQTDTSRLNEKVAATLEADKENLLLRRAARRAAEE
ncbi:hypothetical protein DFH28DRAFT_901943 [Melampsora americana]|nr:hypothetical protein DFH28DRAFT_901943 [Melampsora americana]